jgi:hypothetical protein
VTPPSESEQMGLLDFFMGIQEPVDAEYRLTSCTPLPKSGTHGSCDMVGEVTGSGLVPSVVDHNAPFVALEKWPKVGDVLPVLVDRDNPTFLKVKWKDILPRG